MTQGNGGTCNLTLNAWDVGFQRHRRILSFCWMAMRYETSYTVLVPVWSMRSTDITCLQMTSFWYANRYYPDTIYNWGRVCKEVSRAGTSNYILQTLWGVTTCTCSWYLLNSHLYSNVLAMGYGVTYANSVSLDETLCIMTTDRGRKWTQWTKSSPILQGMIKPRNTVICRICCLEWFRMVGEMYLKFW